MLNQSHFPQAISSYPSGYYAHIVTLRVTTGYALFQTDGELNRTRAAAGIVNTTPMTRITMFKRKQTTPERLHGRELLRRYELINDDCKYNEKPCGQCADCVTYGFAVGDSGSEKSKVFVDSAFSLTEYASSHEVFTFNAPYEDGTMTERGQVTSRINSQDHVKPQTIFPAVITTRDLTLPLFNYVLMNVATTRRYGATTTRGGTMRNHILAVVLADGEIFSNLNFTQMLYDRLIDAAAIDEHDPVEVNVAADHALDLLPDLLHADGVRTSQKLVGDELMTYLNGLFALDSDGARDLLAQSTNDASAYYKAYIKNEKKKKK
jgi:CRISPR-associated protein Csc2